MNEIVKKNGITYGIISGVLAVIITALVYSFNIDLFVSWWLMFIKVAAFTTVAILLLLKTKKEINFNFNFKQSFKTYFIFAVISLLIATSFEIILFNFIDPKLKDTLKEMSIKLVVQLLEKYDTPSATIKEAVAKIQDNDQFSVIELVKGYFTYLVLSCILGLILAALFKTKTKETF